MAHLALRGGKSTIWNVAVDMQLAKADLVTGVLVGTYTLAWHLLDTAKAAVARAL